MRRPPIRIRTFILGVVLVLLVVPILAGGAAWLIERNHQRAGLQRRRDSAVAYLTTHRAEMNEPAAIQGFARLLDRGDLLAQLTLIAGAPPAKHQLYLSPSLPAGTPWAHDPELQIAAGTRKDPATLVTDLYYRPASRTSRALAALLAGVLVLLAGLAAAAWLAGRWMVSPLSALSAEVDRVAGGELTITVPRSRIVEISNIGQAVEGMTAGLGENARQRAEADEARGFLVTSIAHDLRTPLFALRGHLQAIGSRLGDPAIHLARAEARADALERLIGNLFAYTRDDFTQPALQLEAIPLANLLHEVTAGLEHAARVRNTTLELDGDEALGVIADRDRLKRVLTNVVDNAIRHSPPGGSIRLSWAAADDSNVELAIRDHGPWVDPELLPHIFEPGIRGSSSTATLDSGAGLGLAIARRLLEHLDGAITARNRPDGGAELRLTIRRAPSSR